MKTRNILYAALSVSVSLASCDDFLNTMPDERAEVNTPQKVTSLLVSAYSTSSAIMLAELSSDNAYDNGVQYDVYEQEQEDAYLWNDITATGNDAPGSIWDGYYKAIASANQALQAIEELGNPQNLQGQKGEALICRAYGHFVLANTFCLAYNPLTAGSDLGLPYSEKPETQVSVHYTRGTMEELYQKIDQDISAALPLIDDRIYTTPKYHFNKKAAHAFAARFNLYYQKYDKVIQYANVVLGDNPQRLLRDWKANSTSASNYQLRCDAYISASNPANLLLMTGTSAWPYIHGPYSIGKRYGHTNATLFTTETVRAPGVWGAAANLHAANSVWGSDQKVCISKMAGYFEYTDKVNGIGLLHLVAAAFTTDETLLCRAEAYLLQSAPDYAKATDDIKLWMTTHCSVNVSSLTTENIVAFYNGVKYMPLNPKQNSDHTIKKKLNPLGFTLTEGNQENLIQCILHLRRIESIHEGLRWYDVKRYGIEFAHNRDGLVDDVLKLDDPRRAIQLPQDVISAGLEANPR